MGLFDPNQFANNTSGGVRGVAQVSNVGSQLSQGNLQGNIQLQGTQPAPAPAPASYTGSLASVPGSQPSFSQYFNGVQYTDPQAYQQALIQDAHQKHDQTVTDANSGYLDGRITFQDRQKAIQNSLTSLKSLYDPTNGGSGTIQADYGRGLQGLGSAIGGTFSSLSPGASQSNQAVLYDQGKASLDQQKEGAVQGAMSAYDAANAQQNQLGQYGEGLAQQYVNTVGSQYAGQQAQQAPDQYGDVSSYLNKLGGTPVTGSADAGLTSTADGVRNFVSDFNKSASNAAAARTATYTPLDIANFINSIVTQGADLGYASKDKSGNITGYDPMVLGAINAKLGQGQGGAGLSPKDLKSALDQYQNKSGVKFY